MFKVLVGSVWNILLWMINYIVEKCDITISTSAVPEGTRIGGADLPDVKDKYILIRFFYNGVKRWTGYWQAS